MKTRKSSAQFHLRFIPAAILVIILISLLANPASQVQAASSTFVDIPGAAIAIPDPAAGFSCTASITRTINIAPTFQVGDINVGLNISHAVRSQIRVTLQSPSGTLVTLITGAGLGSPTVASPDDYDNYDVLLDDTSVGSLYDNDNDLIAAPFYDRTARPNNLLNKFKGENANGNWTLTICDTRNGTAGTYNRAQLVFTSADPNTIAGTVFTDYNDNGVRGQGDIGVGTVTVSAYDNTGALVDTDITTATGAYSLTIPDGTAVRLEFSTIPANLRPGAFGTDSGTTVQFVTSPAIGVDLGLSQPEDYCNNNPLLVMPCYVNGDPAGGGSAGTRDVLVSIPYEAYGRQDTTLEKPLATGVQIGSTWGLAFQRATGTIYAAAIAKRHSGYGPLGAGGIYAVGINPLTGASTFVNNFVDIATLGIPIGTLANNTGRGLPATSNTPNTDPTAWDAVGKSAIGDIDMGSNDDTLWLVNLADQTLYSIYVGIPASIPTAADVTAYPITLPAGATACPTGDIRPWAVEIYRGDIYIGVVCSAESTNNVANLRGYVIRMDEAAPAGFSLTFEFALNYPRGIVSEPGVDYPAEWLPWSPTMTSICINAGGDCVDRNDLAYNKQIIYPQPILSDIEFDTNGDMILGLMDRTGHQVGNANYATAQPWGTVNLYRANAGTYTIDSVTLPAGTYEGVAAGDLLRVCKVAGVFTLENNATCGSITTGGAGSVPGQGPGNGEYYWQDMYNVSTNINGGTHNEVTLGGLVLFPGTDEIAVSMYDPFNITSGGLAWFSNTTGRRTRAYEIFGQDEGGVPTTFGKAAGIGDVEGFCYNAPIEIGNRVWNDTDGDGIQEPGELPIAGVTVQLYQGATLISTVVTDSNGNYFFSSGPGTSSGSHEYLLDGINPNETYEIRIPNIQGGSQQASLAGLTLAPIDTDLDQRDSDGALSGNNAIISITTGNPGDNNHTYDFGFTSVYSLGNRVWLDDGTGVGGVADNGVQDGTELGIDGVVINLYADTDNDGIPDGAILSTKTTAGGGYYRFDDLAAGNYIVEVAASNFTGVGALVGKGASSSVDETDPDSDVDLNDNGLGIVPDILNGIRSGTVTLGPGTTEPTNDNDPLPNPAATLEASNDHSNRTVDFGFVPSYSLGNRVWFDTDNSGTINGTEVGIPGVRVELYLDDGGTPGVYDGTNTIVSFMSTNASGYYRFDNLAVGGYVVVIPADNFRDVGVGDTVAGDPLAGYLSSGTGIANDGTVTDSIGPDADTIATDSDDNGVTSFTSNAVNYVSALAVTLGPGTSEPTGETDTSGVAGEAPDAQSNLTVDFGFYRQQLSNQTFLDVNNNGTYDAGDTALVGATVHLYASNGTTEIITGADGIRGTADDGYGPDGISGNADDGNGGVITGIGGTYLFSGLPQGDYIVKVTPPVGVTSTVDTADAADTTDPDTNTDNNDNGAGTAGGQVSSGIVTLTPGQGTGGSAGAANNVVTNSSGTTTDPTVDFGFIAPLFSLGNRVWFDTDNSGTINGTEVGIPGVRVELYLDDGDGVFDAGDTVAATAVTTDANGYYRFDNLIAGDYVVVIPSDNFRNIGVGDTVAGDPLAGYLSSGTSIASNGTVSDSVGPDADTIATDSDDNGVTSFTSNTVNYVSAQAVTLGPGTSEPTGETDLSASGQGTADNRADMTVDFGFYRQQLSDQIFVDVNNNGTYDAGDTALVGVTVQLYASNGTTEIITGADGIPGTADDGYGPDGISGNADDGNGGVLTGAGGTYLFDGLPQGIFIVKVTPPIGYASAVDTANSGDSTSPNNNINNNDNGVGVGIGQASSNPVTLTPGSAGAATNNTVSNATGTTTNPTLDFGFVRSNGITKAIIDTDQIFTDVYDVAIGEIITYEITIDLPVGVALTNVTVTDSMDKGLAFVDCLSVILAGSDVTGTVCPSPPPSPPPLPTVSSITDPGDLITNPANSGREVLFTIGNIAAPTVPATLVIQYRAIVLDVIENQDAVTLNNSVTWAWDGGSFSTSAPNVTIVEPDLAIDKSATPTSNVVAGTPIQFTLVINHTVPSTTDAFDVVVTDILPAGLEYVPCTPIAYSGLVPTTQPDTCNLPNGNELVFGWDSFPLNQTATIVFFARFDGTQPSLVNIASLVWTSLPLDPGIPPQLSVYNTASTERDYDPGDLINVYQVSDSVRINPPPDDSGGVNLPKTLPLTGFAPYVVTALSEQPAAKLYNATDVWLEIPSLGVYIPIVGVPLVDGDWDVSWLLKQAGWLNGTAFPGWEGNSALTGHVYLSNGKPGPFIGLGKLKWGDKIIVHANGSIYTYEVRENLTVSPSGISVLKHEDDYSRLTLITCKTYNEATNSYANRIAVRAILISVQKDKLEKVPKIGR